VVLCSIIVDVAMCLVELFYIRSNSCWGRVHSRKGVFSHCPCIVHI
jgi:hypothetical protein